MAIARSRPGWYFARSVFTKDDELIERFDFSDVTAEAVEFDPRKVTWLWNTTAKVHMVFRPVQQAGPPAAHYLFKGLFRMIPPDNFTPCWFEIQQESSPVPPPGSIPLTQSGPKNSVAAVTRAWREAAKRHDADVAAKKFSSDRDIEWDLLRIRGEVANLLKISFEEVEEIVDESLKK